jgi:hypothetical protein
VASAASTRDPAYIPISGRSPSAGFVVLASGLRISPGHICLFGSVLLDSVLSASVGEPEIERKGHTKSSEVVIAIVEEITIIFGVAENDAQSDAHDFHPTDLSVN